MHMPVLQFAILFFCVKSEISYIFPHLNMTCHCIALKPQF